MSKKPEFIPTPPFENTLASADLLVTRTFELLPDPEHLTDAQLTETLAKLGRMTVLLVEGEQMLRQELERRED